VLAVAAIGGPSPLVVLASHGSDEVAPEAVTALRDDAIDESSGAVVRGDSLFTVNDSGDGPHLYEVDLRTGETVALTTFAEDDPEDVEALARGRDGDVWVADIGDNRRSRGSVRLFRVTPPPAGGTVRAATFDLTYPDGPHDAEALLAHPRTGRLLVVTKTVLRGGVVYRAPRRLSPGGTHQLERVGRVPGIVTGGAFLPDGRHVLLRTYGQVALYTYPGLEQVASADVATQQQGEAVAVGDDGRVYLTSEGEGSQILVTDVPERGPDPDPDADPAPQPQDGGTEQAPAYDPQPWMGLGPWGLLGAVAGSTAVLALLLAAVRAARRRSRRRP
jgi:hypothetical protein